MLQPRTLVFIVMLIGSGQSLTPQSPKEFVQPAFVAKGQFDIGPSYVHMPEKFFLLVRKGQEIGAIRFIKIEQNTSSLGKSMYESYFQSDGSGSFLSANVVKHSGEIEIKPLRGVSHSTMWQPGPDKLRVGKWWFGCLSPSLVNMSSHFSEKDEGYEFAPTSAQNIADIDASDKRLRWFRFDPNVSIKVPVSGLPR